jgi:glyoxylase-like metal-dependent hydrolase (beta-lactamase superfamily II)
MKRWLLGIGLVVGVLVIVVVAVLAATFLGRQSIADGTKIGRVRIVKDGIVSVGVINVGAGQVALVDAGTDGEGKAILAELSRRQIQPSAVTAILITHGHQDHTAAIKLFPQARVVALEKEVGLVEGTEGAHGPVTQLMPVSPTGVKVSWPVRDGETIAVGEVPVRVFAIPGHTAGSAAYLVDGVLFLGDAADTNDKGEVLGSPWIFSDSQAQDRESLVHLADVLQKDNAEVKALAFAHSGVRTEGLAPLQTFARNNASR